MISNPMLSDTSSAAGGDNEPGAILAVDRLRKYFPIRGGLLNRPVGYVHAVDDVSFSVFRGETLGIVGESGCGKSTLARLLMQLMPADAGVMEIGGSVMRGRGRRSLREMRRMLQMVFQDSHSSLNPRLPIEASVTYGPRVHGIDPVEARRIAHDLLRKVGLDPLVFGKRYPHELSGGQKQRVNIARALALQPQVVILDEAVSALDKSIEAQVLNLLRSLKRDLGLTYLFISHDLGVVQYISDRILVMYLGQIVEVGPVERVYGAPKHPYTAALLASRLAVNPDERIESPPLTGDPPNPIDPGAGCRFRSRCAFAEDVCARVTPQLGRGAGRSAHVAACHLGDPASGHSKASIAANSVIGREGHD